MVHRVSAPTGSAGSEGQRTRMTWWDVGRRFAHMESPVIHYCGTEALRSFYGAGGHGDRRCRTDHGDRKATPPTTLRLEFHRHQCLTLG